jgi:hypothetical protein
MKTLSIFAFFGIAVAVCIAADPPNPTPETIAKQTHIAVLDTEEGYIGAVVNDLRKATESRPPFYRELNVIYFSWSNPYQKSREVKGVYKGLSVMEILRDAARQTQSELKVTKDAIYLFPKSELDCFQTHDGRMFVTVVGLRSDGAVCNPNLGRPLTTDWTKLPLSGPGLEAFKDLVVVPYSQLPEELQRRYNADDAELDRQIKAGVEGKYGTPEGINALAGIAIELLDGKFTLSSFSDAGDPSKPSPVCHGNYILRGHWLILENRKLEIPEWVITEIHGKLFLLDPNAYLKWKNEGLGDDLGWQERR